MFIETSLPPLSSLSSPSFHSICWINILLDRGLFWIDSLSELHRKASFFRTLDLYWLSYLSISGPAEPLHFLARSLSLHLRLFASLSPPSACVCPRLSPRVFLLFFSPRNASFYHLFPALLPRPKHIFVQNDLVVELQSAAGPAGMTYFLRLISLSVCWPAFVSIFGGFCFPLFVFSVGPRQCYLCFAHLSPHYLLCHGTVNVSDRDRSRWKSTPSFVLCLFCYPSLTRFLFISGRRSRARSLSGSQVYTLEGEKGFKQTASLLLT